MKIIVFWFLSVFTSMMCYFQQDRSLTFHRWLRVSDNKLFLVNVLRTVLKGDHFLTSRNIVRWCFRFYSRIGQLFLFVNCRIYKCSHLRLMIVCNLETIMVPLKAEKINEMFRGLGGVMESNGNTWSKKLRKTTWISKWRVGEKKVKTIWKSCWNRL